MSKEKQQSIALCRRDFLEVRKAPPARKVNSWDVNSFLNSWKKGNFFVFNQGQEEELAGNSLTALSPFLGTPQGFWGMFSMEFWLLGGLNRTLTA